MKGEKNEEPMERNEKKEVDKEGEDDKKEIPEIEMMEENEPEKMSQSKVVFGTCNHYFTAYRRFRHLDQKVG